MNSLNCRESGAVIAGLRILQALRTGGTTNSQFFAAAEGAVEEIAEDGGNQECLSSEEIDRLIDKLQDL